MPTFDWFGPVAPLTGLGGAGGQQGPLKAMMENVGGFRH
jgi:hypothetical protein